MFLVNLYIYAKADQLGMGEIAILINKGLLYLVALPVFALKQVKYIKKISLYNHYFNSIVH